MPTPAARAKAPMRMGVAVRRLVFSISTQSETRTVVRVFPDRRALSSDDAYTRLLVQMSTFTIALPIPTSAEPEIRPAQMGSMPSTQ